MKAQLLKGFAILVVSFAGCWFVFSVFLPIPDLGTIKLPDKQERKLGDLIFKYTIELDASYDSVNYAQILQHLGEIERVLNADSLDLKLHVVKMNAPNAFTLPGGVIVVSTSLLSTVDHTEEVAAVIAHEMGHVYHRHVIKKLAHEFGVAMLTAVVTGGDPPLTAEITKALLSNYFSREHEREADAYAVELLELAGLSPLHLANAFEFLKRYGSTSEEFEIISTHPSIDKRIEMIQSGNYPAPTYAHFTFDLDEVTALINVQQ